MIAAWKSGTKCTVNWKWISAAFMIHFLSETNEASVASLLAVSSEVRSLLLHIRPARTRPQLHAPITKGVRRNFVTPSDLHQGKWKSVTVEQALWIRIGREWFERRSVLPSWEGHCGKRCLRGLGPPQRCVSSSLFYQRLLWISWEEWRFLALSVR